MYKYRAYSIVLFLPSFQFPRVLELLNLSEISHCNQEFNSQLARPSAN